MSSPIFARVYSNLIVRGMARSGGTKLRRRLLAGLEGIVVEVGAGDGANFAHYPPEVRRVVAVEPDPYLRGRACQAIGDRPVEIIDGDAAALDLPDGRADAVVFCLVLCSVPEVAAALAEARRVLAPGGELRFFEHVQAPEKGITRRLQRGLDATVWPHLFGGCHCGRDTAAAIERAGFAIESLERLVFPAGSRLPMSPAILGSARSL